MSLMSDLYVGSSGLRVSQNALNTIGHNLANVETKGYVRQQTVLKTSSYNTIGQSYISAMQTGRGVDTAIVRQVRDAFLDKSYRQEYGRQGYYDSQNEAASEVEDLFGELEGVAFQDSLESFWTALQELSKEPDSLTAKATLASTSVSFMERAETIYEQLSTYQLSLNTKIEEKVNRINEIGYEISELNNRITFYECSNVEHANDLRDQRNSLLDELGQMASISYNEDTTGKVTVKLEEAAFITEDFVYPMATMTVMDLRKEQLGEDYVEAEGSNENSTMLVPVWPALKNVEVFSLDPLPESELNTDVGSLKGLLLARGTKVANYTDIPIAPEKADYLDEDGELDEEAYDIATKQYEEEVQEYNLKIDSSIVMSTQAKFDQLIHGVVTTINNILSPNKEVTVGGDVDITLADGTALADGTVIQILDDEIAPIGSDGEAGFELFSRKSCARYKEATMSYIDEDGNPQTKTVKIYNKEVETDNYSLYTLGEIEINKEILQDATKIPLNANDGTGEFDIETAEKLISAWQVTFATLDPNSLTEYNFNDYYTAFTGSIATTGEKMNTIASTQESLVNSIDNERTSTHGVSSDDELTDLIKFQQSYNAASRYFTVIDEMLEHIVTRL